MAMFRLKFRFSHAYFLKFSMTLFRLKFRFPYEFFLHFCFGLQFPKKARHLLLSSYCDWLFQFNIAYHCSSISYWFSSPQFSWVFISNLRPKTWRNISSANVRKVVGILKVPLLDRFSLVAGWFSGLANMLTDNSSHQLAWGAICQDQTRFLDPPLKQRQGLNST